MFLLSSRAISILCICFQSRRLVVLPATWQMRISEGFPGFPLQPSSIPQTFLNPSGTNVVLCNFSLIWIPAMKAQMGLGFVSHLFSVLNSGLEGEQYLPHAERETYKGSKSKSQHLAAFVTS